MPATRKKRRSRKGALRVAPRVGEVIDRTALRPPSVLAHEVMAARLEMTPEALTADLSLAQDLGLDDAAATDLVIAVEEALDVRFPDDFLDGLHTYGQLHRAVHVAVG